MTPLGEMKMPEPIIQPKVLNVIVVSKCQRSESMILANDHIDAVDEVHLGLEADGIAITGLGLLLRFLAHRTDSSGTSEQINKGCSQLQGQ